MISYIEGNVIHTDLKSVILSAGGVGYKVFCTFDTLHELQTKVGSKSALWTYLAVRDNALDLYGFLTQDELRFFELLITVSGIGPKTALGILNVASVRILKSAIISGDPSQLTKISGIGKKNAEKIVLELKNKFEGEAAEGENAQDEVDAIEALKSLGYSEKQAKDALKKVPKEITSTSDRIKQSLKILGSSTK